jgi:hypothetical protein
MQVCTTQGCDDICNFVRLGMISINLQHANEKSLQGHVTKHSSGHGYTSG